MYLGGIRPPRHPQQVGLEASKYQICIGNLIQIKHFGSAQADLLEGGLGEDAPRRNKLEFVFSQPRASTRTGVVRSIPRSATESKTAES
jgi:hypothetical protein